MASDVSRGIVVVMLTSWAFGGCRLNASAVASTRTPQLHLTRLLRVPLSLSPGSPGGDAFDGGMAVYFWERLRA